MESLRITITNKRDYKKFLYLAEKANLKWSSQHQDIPVKINDSRFPDFREFYRYVRISKDLKVSYNDSHRDSTEAIIMSEVYIQFNRSHILELKNIIKSRKLKSSQTKVSNLKRELGELGEEFKFEKDLRISESIRLHEVNKQMYKDRDYHMNERREIEIDKYIYMTLYYFVALATFLILI